VQERLPIPSIGVAHRGFEVRLALLENYYQKEGQIECIVLGSSMVGQGIDPNALSEGFEQIRGHPLTCFNFGIEGLTAGEADNIAHLLIMKFHPNVLVYGTSARDFSEKAGEPLMGTLMSPWVAYESGSPNIQGFLIDKLVSLRYALVYRNWMSPDYENFLANVQIEKDDYSMGYHPSSKIADNLNQHPDQESEKAFFRVMSDYKPDQQDIAGLEGLVKQGNSEVQIVIAEIPVHETYMEFFDHGENDYQLFLNRVEKIADLYQVPFFQVMPLNIFPDNAWSNRNHLNSIGAEIYSFWLGESLAGVLP